MTYKIAAIFKNNIVNSGIDLTGIATWYFCSHRGLFMDGCPHGHGRIKWPEGTVYDGNWNHGELHGQGTYICTWVLKFG